jgi:hypothetical protein
MSDAPPARPMKYPYTFSAKVAQFPLRHYLQNNWLWKYYFIAVVASIPLFYKITKLCKYQTFTKIPTVSLILQFSTLHSQQSREHQEVG